MSSFRIASLLIIALHGPAMAGETLHYPGMCDASAAVAIDRTRFVVASDEDNILRIYDKDKPGPAREIDLDDFLTAPDPGRTARRVTSKVRRVSGTASTGSRRTGGTPKPKRDRSATACSPPTS